MDNADGVKRRHRVLNIASTRAETNLVPIGWAIGGMLALALAITATVAAVLFIFLPFKPFKAEALSAATLYDLLKVAFAFAAGIGGVVALVTAYRRQRVAESAQELAIRAEKHQRTIADRADVREATRLFNERFTTAAGQLGHDSPAVRLAGVYAIAGLADDWFEQRQTCVDVLCAYMRMPHQPEPGNDASVAELQAFRSLREVRHTVIRVITAHLQPDNQRATSVEDWRGLDFDFTGASFDGGNFRGAVFGYGTTSFRGAHFSGGKVDFSQADFSGGAVDFSASQFIGGRVNFNFATFDGGNVNFSYAQFNEGVVSFARTKFSGGSVSFSSADFGDGMASFHEAEFSRGNIDFRNANFNGKGRVDFGHAKFSGGIVNFSYSNFRGSRVSFDSSKVSGGTLDFTSAMFNGGTVDFDTIEVSGGTISFHKAKFNSGTVSFYEAKVNYTVDFLETEFTGGQVNFGSVLMWAHPPIGLSFDDPPPGVTVQPALHNPGFT